MKELKRKLSSRKLWCGVASFVTALYAAFNIDTITREQALLIVSGIGGLCCYMFAEGKVDAAGATAQPGEESE